MSYVRLSQGRGPLELAASCGMVLADVGQNPETAWNTNLNLPRISLNQNGTFCQLEPL